MNRRPTSHLRLSVRLKAATGRLVCIATTLLAAADLARVPAIAKAVIGPKPRSTI